MLLNYKLLKQYANESWLITMILSRPHSLKLFSYQVSSVNNELICSICDFNYYCKPRSQKHDVYRLGKVIMIKQKTKYAIIVTYSFRIHVSPKGILKIYYPPASQTTTAELSCNWDYLINLSL